MKPLIKLALILMTASQIGCALGPILSGETGRTVGDGRHEFDAVLGSTGYYGLKYKYGILEQLDFGFQYEALSMSLFLKHSFLKQDSGTSFAGLIGTGASLGGSFNFADLILSYKADKWEPYGSVRYVSVTTAQAELKDVDTGDIFTTIDSEKYAYGQVFLGSKYWFSPKFNLNMEISSLMSLDSKVEFKSDILASFGFNWEFD